MAATSLGHDVPTSKEQLTRYAIQRDVLAIQGVYTRVLEDLATLGKQHEIAPLDFYYLNEAISGGRCLVTTVEERVIGFALQKYDISLMDIYKDPAQAQTIQAIDWAQARPCHFVHSLMLDPSLQGRGFGTKFMQDIIRHIEKSSVKGTIFLDCSGRNESLKCFYKRIGFQWLCDIPEMSWKLSVFRLQLG